MTEARSWTIRLPYLTPPLSLNQRLKWQAQYRITSQLKSDVGWLLKGAKVPPLGRVRVELIWTPINARRRDADNPEPTRKAAIDAIVAAGIVPDDTPQFVERPEIGILEPDPRHPSLMLVLTEVEA